MISARWVANQVLNKIIRRKCSNTASTLPKENQFALTLRRTAMSSYVGKIGLPINTASEFPDFSTATLNKCRRNIRSLNHYKSMTPSEIVQSLDRISDLVCSVADPAQLISHIVHDDEWQDAANTVLLEMNSEIAQMNLNLSLVEALNYALKSPESLTEEELFVATRMQEEFIHEGCQLPPQERKAASELVVQMHTLANAQAVNLESRKGAALPLQIPSPYIEHLSKEVQEVIHTSRGKANLPISDHWRKRVLEELPDAGVRRDILSSLYHSYVKPREELLDIRHTVANHMRFESYSHYGAHKRWLRNPAEVTDFLDSFKQELIEPVKKDIDILTKKKNSMLLGSGTSVKSDQPFPAWDYPYYKRYCLQQQSHTSDFNDKHDISDYLTLNNVLYGISQLWQKLFRIRLEFVVPEPGETYHFTVIKVEFFDETNQHLGVAYLDLLSRSGKPISANYPLRLRSDHWSLPSVVLTTNIRFDKDLLNAGDYSVYSVLNQFKLITLQFHELKTLFHEIGHLTQAVMSKNSLQHSSGTRGFHDTVEIPSTLFELFATDYRVVSNFARHYRTGDSLPISVFEHAMQKETQFAAIHLEENLIMAALDHNFHTTPPTRRHKGQSHAYVPGYSNKIVSETLAKYSSFLYPPGMVAFLDYNPQHLITYGGFFYTYLYSGVYSSHLYEHLFGEYPFNTEAGLLYRDHFLKYGGSRHPSAMFQTIVGKAPHPQYHLKHHVQGRL